MSIKSEILKEIDRGIRKIKRLLINTDFVKITFKEIRKDIVNKLDKMIQEKEGTCEWKSVENGYKFSCGRADFHLQRIADWKYCQYCGKKIVETK
jgi:hypothetical protein